MPPQRVEMKQIIFLLLLCSCNLFADESTQQELCGDISYNYNYHFGPERSQAGTGSCYAFSVAALLEEDNYLRFIGQVPNSFFYNNISVIDIQRCDMAAGHGLGGIDGKTGLENDYAFFCMDCALYNGGACLEKYAMFDTKSKLSLTKQKGRFDDFMSIYDDWTELKKQKGFPENLHISGRTEYFWNYLPKDEKDPLSGDGYSFAHFADAFYKAKDRINFLNLILTTKDCEKNRFKFDNMVLASENFYLKNYDDRRLYKKDKMDIIKGALSNKRSVIAILSNGSLTHAGVITGVRMNNGVCELYLRSSMEKWAGEQPWTSGWRSADSLLITILSIKYLKEIDPYDFEKAREAFLQKNINDEYDKNKGNIMHAYEKW